jgi:hypothetical protein
MGSFNVDYSLGVGQNHLRLGALALEAIFVAFNASVFLFL